MRIEIAPKTIVVVLATIAGIFLLGMLAKVIAVVVVALVLVGTLDPLVGWLERHGFRRGRALALVFLAAAVVLCAVVVLMIPPIVSQIASLLGDAPAVRDRALAAVAGYKWAAPFAATLRDLPVDQLAQHAGMAALASSPAVFEMLGYGISTLFLSIYLLADPQGSKGLLYILVPRRHHVKLAKVLIELEVIVGGYMRGQLVTSAAITAFVFAVLTIAGAEDALALALFAGLTDIIPFVGGYIASTPVVIAVAPQGAPVAIGVAILMIAYQEFESRILVPRVYGRALRLPPAIVLVALLVGGTLGGVLGALLALPIAAGLQMVLRELRVALPGEAGVPETARTLDRRTKLVYEQLAEGASAVEAGMIADNLAATARLTEQRPSDLP